MTQQSKLQLIQNLPTPQEMAQVIPSLKSLNQKIRELERKVSRLELAAAQPPKKTKRFKLF